MFHSLLFLCLATPTPLRHNTDANDYCNAHKTQTQKTRRTSRCYHAEPQQLQRLAYKVPAPSPENRDTQIQNPNPLSIPDTNRPKIFHLFFLPEKVCPPLFVLGFHAVVPPCTCVLSTAQAVEVGGQSIHSTGARSCFQTDLTTKQKQNKKTVQNRENTITRPAQHEPPSPPQCLLPPSNILVVQQNKHQNIADNTSKPIDRASVNMRPIAAINSLPSPKQRLHGQSTVAC